ncbi:MAG: T9SS type A sorting domain-containing protein, partial [Sphingobacteriaceae bacterium]
IAAIMSLKKNYLAEADKATFTLDGITKSMHLTAGDLHTTIIGNFDIVSKSVNPKFEHAGLWYDYFTGLPIEVKGTDDPYTLAAGEFHIFTDKPVAFPEKGLVPFTVKPVNISIEPKPEKYGISVYPNPSTGIFDIKLDAKVSDNGTINVYTFTGRKITAPLSVISDRHYRVNISAHPNGMYVLNLQSGSQSVNVRLLKQ